MMAEADQAQEIRAEFPAKLRPLFRPKRYKVMHGGRGGGKSWAVARALLLMAADRTLRVLCAREIQKSMKESVHRLLKDQIVSLGLESEFEVLENEIRGYNGSVFLFTGLQSHTVDSIKSYESVDVCWIEEAHGVSKKSWDVLIPTIRKAGSEIWLTLNPDMDTDETWVRFCAAPSPDTWVCEINWRDNPWFPDVLKEERRKAQASMPQDDYENIWEGKPKRVAAGAIYRHEIEALFKDGRICPVPYDPMLPVHTVWDLGWNDAMTIIMVQRTPTTVNLIDYIEDSNRTYAWYVAEMEKKGYRWGTDFLPHDGAAANPQTGISSIQTLKNLGRNVADPLPAIDVEEGIKQARMIFPKCYFDQHKTARLQECLKRYRRSINQRTNEPMGPLHDEYSHGCLVGESLVLTARGEVAIRDVAIGDKVWTPAGFAAVLNSGPTKVAIELIEITSADGTVLIATPEHKIFTTRGVVTAGALRHDDCVYNQRSHPCLSSQNIELMGYRDAVIESFKASGIGTGQPETCTPTKSAESNACCTLRSTKRSMASLKAVCVSALQMVITAMSRLRTGFNSEDSAPVSTLFRKWMEYAFTGSQMATTKLNTGSMAASPCTDMCGRSTMAPSQMDSTFITRTATKRTTPSTIWSFFQRLSIPFTTEKKPHGLEAKRTETKLSELAIWQNIGTPAMKDGGGTREPQSKRGKIANGPTSPANSAAKSSQPHTQHEPSFATPIAGLRRYVPEEKTLVYDLTVEHHHCYLANGVLVSNSDAFRYLGMAVPLMRNEVAHINAFANRTRESWR